MVIRDEGQLRRYLIPIINSMGHASAVESHAMSPGIPDIDYCVEGVEGHIETKISGGNRMGKFRSTQTRWFRRRVEAGGRPLALAFFASDGLFVVAEGKHVGELARDRSRTNWMDRSLITWTGEINVEQFRAILTFSTKV